MGALATVSVIVAIVSVGPEAAAETQGRVVTVKKGVIQQTVTGTGNLQPANEVDLGFSTSGTIEKVDVKEGDHVSAGQLIARLDDARQVVAVAQAEAALESAQSALDDAQEAEDDGDGDATAAVENGLTTASAASSAPVMVTAAFVDARAMRVAAASISSVGGVPAGSNAGATPRTTTTAAAPAATTTKSAPAPSTKTAPTTTAPATTTKTAPATTPALATTTKNAPATTPGAASATSTSDAPADRGGGSGSGGGSAGSAGSGAASGSGAGAVSGAAANTSSGAASGVNSGAASGTSSGAATGANSSAASGLNSGAAANTSSGASSNSTSGAGSGAGAGASSSAGATTVASAKAAVASAELDVQDAKAALKDTRLYAPVAGTITALNGSAGSSASGTSSASSSGSAAASGSAASGGAASGGSSGGTGTGATSTDSSASSSFATLQQLSRLDLEVSFSESDIGDLKVGQAATVTVTALESIKLAAKVTEIGTTSTSSSGVVSYPVTLAVTQTAKGVLPGMSASAEVVTKQAKGISVPSQAISGRTVTVKTGDAERQAAITTGVVGDSVTQVLTGLSAGDQVVLPALASTSSSGSAAGSATGRGGAAGGAAGGFPGGAPTGAPGGGGFPGGRG